MTPAARTQSAIELLDQIIAAARDGGAAADTLIARFFAERRYAGSKDRRAVRELVYEAIRRCGDRPHNGRTAILGLVRDRPELRESFDGSSYGPAVIAAGERWAPASLLPTWLVDRFSSVVGKDEQPALLERAPLDLRVNRLKSDRATVLAAFADAVPTPHAPDGVRLVDNIPVEQHELWDQGAIEVQDEGSQLLALACHAGPGMTVVDLCAGAGGKTLALAAAMANDGRIVASDTVRDRLRRLEPRAARAGVSIIETRLLDEGRELEMLDAMIGLADIVLIDAPCSGTGTWRRNPEARWRLNPARLERLVTLQARLLDVGAALVRPGGALVYAVCSLLAEEGAGQAAGFLARTPGWTANRTLSGVGRADGPGLLLTPGHDRTDGFFVAGLKKP